MKTMHICKNNNEFDLTFKTPYIIWISDLEDAIKKAYSDYHFIDELNIKKLFYPEGYMNDSYVRFVFRDGDCPNYDTLSAEDFKDMDDCYLKELILRKLVVEFLDTYIEKEYSYNYILLDVSW